MSKDSNSRTHRNKIKQKKILETAWKLFLQHGYEKTSLQMIVKETGGSLATIYKTFKNKQTLFQEAIKANDEEFIATLKQDFNQMDQYTSLEDCYYQLGIHCMHRIFNKDVIPFLRLIMIENYHHPELMQMFKRITIDAVRYFFLKPLDKYAKIHHLKLKDIEESINVFSSLFIDRYILDVITMPNYPIPNEQEIQHIVKRAVKIFMLYLQHYKEIE